jgi:osmotically-inducible protein OsmY
MYPAQIAGITPGELSRCEERRQKKNDPRRPDPIQKADEVIKERISSALWKDDVLRALEYYEIDVRVKNGVVHLNGHIVSSTSRRRVENALQSIDGVLEIRNNLILDDKLALDVASSLGKLEHMHGCKFFTGASHGVVSLNGVVSNQNVGLLAEKLAASNPDVRGVINNVRVSSMVQDTQAQPFLQPAIGEMIYFLDGICGVVRQVIIDPNNRRVVAMTLQGKFVDANLQTARIVPLSEQIIAVPMEAVRYLTRESGFLHISSNERNRYMDFDPAHFLIPREDWKPPYPYCSDEVLFPVEPPYLERQISPPVYSSYGVALEELALKEELTANDSLGG